MTAIPDPGRSTGESPLPSGTVTFLFTDIEASTRRWERDAAAMREAVRRHDELLRATIVESGGRVFKTVGDAFCAAFARPERAVAAGLAAQHALAAEDFSAVGGLHVRVAIHTGTADERQGDYFGVTLNRVARLLAICHGGQLLVSGVTAGLSEDALPPRSRLRDLGKHRLKDLTHPEHVYQLVGDGLPDAFPPLRSLAALPNNLPLQLTSFVGREDEVAEIVELVGKTRLLTIVGTGGVGKTRAALQVAAELLDGSGDGVWFVDLAPLRDSALVAQEVVAALGLTVPPDKTALGVIVDHAKTRRLLLVVDNCEHLIVPVADAIGTVLRACPGVTILATSRESLNVAGERVHRMPSLGLPPEGAALTAAQASAYGAIVLFAERAQAADERFALTDENAATVADVCRRLDGIALAVELAAPRVKVLTLEELSRRLDERFRLLTGGSRSALPRHQTMRALIDWSYDLLSEREKAVFRKAGVFVGGCTLEALAATCPDLDEWELLEALTSLVDKSLVVAETQASQQRYRLLESMREYARARLTESGGLEDAARAHAAFFRTYAETKRDEWAVTPGARWIEPMVPETDNFRTAMQWSLDCEPVRAAELAAALFRFFDHLALQDEGLRWIVRSIERNAQLPPRIEGRLLDAQMTLLINQGRLQGARDIMRRCLVLARASHDRTQLLDALLAHTPFIGSDDPIVLAELSREAVELAEAAGDEVALSRAKSMVAATADLPIEERRRTFESSIATQKRLGRHRVAALTSMTWSVVEMREGDAASLVRAASHTVDLCRSLEPTILLRSLGMLLPALMRAGNVDEALEVAREQVQRSAALGKPFDSRVGVCALAVAQSPPKNPILTARLLGYGDFEAFVTVGVWPIFEYLLDLRERAAARLAVTLGRDAFDACALEGASWDEDRAYRESLQL